MGKNKQTLRTTHELTLENVLNHGRHVEVLGDARGLSTHAGDTLALTRAAIGRQPQDGLEE